MAAGRPPEELDERILGEPRDLADREDPAIVELSRGNRANPPKPLDGERMKERHLAVRRHQEEPIGFGDRARDLGEKLSPRDADGDWETDLLQDPASQPLSNVDWRAGEVLHAANIDECLVDGQPLHLRTRIPENLVHGPAGLRVRRNPGRDHSGLRTKAPGLSPAHRGPDAAGLG